MDACNISCTSSSTFDDSSFLDNIAKRNSNRFDHLRTLLPLCGQRVKSTLQDAIDGNKQFYEEYNEFLNDVHKHNFKSFFKPVLDSEASFYDDYKKTGFSTTDALIRSRILDAIMVLTAGDHQLLQFVTSLSMRKVCVVPENFLIKNETGECITFIGSTHPKGAKGDDFKVLPPAKSGFCVVCSSELFNCRCRHVNFSQRIYESLQMKLNIQLGKFVNASDPTNEGEINLETVVSSLSFDSDFYHDNWIKCLPPECYYIIASYISCADRFRCSFSLGLPFYKCGGYRTLKSIVRQRCQPDVPWDAHIVAPCNCTLIPIFSPCDLIYLGELNYIIQHCVSTRPILHKVYNIVTIR